MIGRPGVIHLTPGNPSDVKTVPAVLEIHARRWPEVAVNVCERAIRDYVRSFSYRHAVASLGRCATTSTTTRSSR